MIVLLGQEIIYGDCDIAFAGKPRSYGICAVTIIPNDEKP
jgi:hypothetical protein